MSQTRDRIMRTYRGVVVIDLPGAAASYRISDKRREDDPTITALQTIRRTSIKNSRNANGDTRVGTWSGGIPQAQIDNEFP